MIFTILSFMSILFNSTKIQTIAIWFGPTKNLTLFCKNVRKIKTKTVSNPIVKWKLLVDRRIFWQVQVWFPTFYRMPTHMPPRPFTEEGLNCNPSHISSKRWKNPNKNLRKRSVRPYHIWTCQNIPRTFSQLDFRRDFKAGIWHQPEMHTVKNYS